MNKSEKLENLGAALAAAQAEMPIVGFDASNPFLRNKYASLGAVIQATRPVLAKHGLAISQFPVCNVNGVSDRQGPSPAEKKGEESGPVTITHREGPNSIGIETVLVHKSGEFISEVLMLPLTKEKGKSDAQMAGSVITYLRRYAWSSVCGIYADEDTDGNDPHDHGAEEDRFEDLRGSQGRQTSRPPSSPPPTAKPAASPTPAQATTAKKPTAMVSQLIARLGGNLGEFTRCLHTRQVNEQGQLVLLPANPIEDLLDAWAKFFLDHFEEELAKVEVWAMANPPETAPAKPVEVPRDANIDPHSPDAAWRKFLMPWGEKKDIPLEKLDKKYLFGLWANYTVETEYKGKPKAPEKIAADQKFRAMLDEAGKHYEFHR